MLIVGNYLGENTPVKTSQLVPFRVGDSKVHFARTGLVLVMTISLAHCADPRPPKITKVLESPIELPYRIGFVNDFAGVLENSARQKLDSDLDEFQQQSGVDFVIVIVESKGGYSLEDHSLEIARQWCLDCRPQSRGEVLLDIAMKDQEFRFNVSKPLLNDLPNEELEKFQQALEQSFSDGEYSQDLIDVVSKIRAKFMQRK
jgi:uncharacterized membrane protein YgcG